VRDLAVVVLAALAGKVDDIRGRAVSELEDRQEVLP